MTNEPGIKWEERSGVGQAITAPSLSVRGILGTAKRGPVYTPPLLLSFSDFEKYYGGFKDDDAGPLGAYAYFAQGGRFMLYGRVVETTDGSGVTAAKHGSRRLLDNSGYATLWAWSRYKGDHSLVSISTQKTESTCTIGVGADQSGSFTFDNATAKITRGAGTWAAAGYAVGHILQVSTTASNNTRFTITALSGADATVSPAPTGSALTDASTVVRCVGATFGDVSGFEAGDVIIIDDATTAISVVAHTITSSTNTIQWYGSAAVTATAVAAAATAKTASRHSSFSTVTGAIGSSDTSFTVATPGAFRVGQHVTVLPGAVETLNVAGDAIKTLTVTAVNDATIEVDGALGYAVATTDGGTPAKKTVIVSQEFGVDVYDDGELVEQYRDISLSSTASGYYVQEKLGDAPTYTVSSTKGYTTASVLASAATSATLVNSSSDVANLKAGQIFKVTADGGAYNAAGVYVQVKTVNTGTGAVTFESIGTRAANPGSSTTSWYAVTLRVREKTEYPQNISNLICVDQASALLTDSENAGVIHLRYPRAVSNVTLTGGTAGTTPSSVASILGDSTPGQKTGLYAWEDADDFTSLAAFAIPGIITAYSGSGLLRQTLDTSASAWAETNGIQYFTDVPSSITTAVDAKVYRNQTLALQSSQTALYFPHLRASDPRNAKRVLTLSPSCYMLGLQAVMTAANGVNTPPANSALRGVQGLTATVSATEHELLNDAGVNVILKKRGRGYLPMGARSLLNKDGTMRHFVNARQWLNFFRKAVESGFDVRLFGVANESAFVFIRAPLESFLAGEFAKGVFAPGSMAEAFAVKVNSETTSAADLEDGLINVQVAVAMAGAIEKIKFIVTGYSGSIRVQEV